MKNDTDNLAAMQVTSVSEIRDCGMWPQICHIKLCGQTLKLVMTGLKWYLLEISVLEDVAILQELPVVLPDPILQLLVQQWTKQ